MYILIRYCRLLLFPPYPGSNVYRPIAASAGCQFIGLALGDFEDSSLRLALVTPAVLLQANNIGCTEPAEGTAVPRGGGEEVSIFFRKGPSSQIVLELRV